MALEKYTVKGFQPIKQYQPVAVKKYNITSDDYRDLVSLLNRVIVRVSSNIVDFNNIRGSETLEQIRKFFHQMVRLKIEQLNLNLNDTHANSSTRPDATPHLQHLALVQGDGGNTVQDAYKLSNEQMQSGYRSYYYDKTVIHWFQPDENNEIFQKLIRKPNPRIRVVPYYQPFTPSPDLLEQLVQESLRTYLGHPYLYIQAKDNIYPESLKTVVQDIKLHLPLLFEQGLSEGVLSRDDVCLNINHNDSEISDLQITKFPHELKAYYKGDILAPRHFDQIIKTLKMGESYQVKGWFVFEGMPKKLPQHPQMLIMPDSFESIFTPQQFYAVMGQIAMGLGDIRGMLPIIFDENNKAVLLWLGAPEAIDQALKETLNYLRA